MADKDNKLKEEEKDQLRKSFNKRISQYCNFAALVIILISFATFVVGKFDSFFIQIGIMVSIALLAIAAIENPTRGK
jgi:magnesium-transporting ATPase (P-type)